MKVKRQKNIYKANVNHKKWGGIKKFILDKIEFDKLL